MANESNTNNFNNDVAVAIAMALHSLNGEAHDVENAVLTFGTHGRLYSPWSSKIYGLRQVPSRR